jgi:hypothetical protein
MRGFARNRRLPAFLLVLTLAAQARSRNEETSMIPPSSVFGWELSGAASRVDSTTIFEYMDGAGELYLGYRFDHLDAFTYKAGDRPDILLEIYRMKTPDDAFGLLSQDWGGEPAVLDEGAHSGPAERTVPESRAVYGAGLLRVWSGDLYLRILAGEETRESRAAVLELGRRLVRGRPEPPRPGLCGALPETAGGGKIDPQSVRFFRSRHVLNSVYFVSYRNILHLNPTVEAVTATYAIPSGSGEARRSPVFIFRYPSGDAAVKALAEFHAAYFPEHGADVPSPSAEDTVRLYPVEGGWAGYRVYGRFAVLVFEISDQDRGTRILQDILHAIQSCEKNQRE